MGQERHFGSIHVALVNTQPALIYPGEAPGIYVPKGQRVGQLEAEGTGETWTYGMGRERQGHPWDRQGHPWHMQEPAQAHTDLQDDGQLLRGVAVLHAHGQPHLEGRELLGEEGAVLGEQRGSAGMG